MINTKRDAKAILTEALQLELDPFLTVHGFTRNPAEQEYTRKCQDGRQFLIAYFEYRPKYQPGADTRIYPQVGACFPELNRLANQMIEPDQMSVEAADISYSVTLDSTLPKGEQTNWFTYGRQDVFDCVKSIRIATERWVIPFLDEYSTVQSLTAAYANHDERFSWHRLFYVHLAAGFLVLRQPDKALAVLEGAFRRGGAKRKFANAFEVVSAHMAARGQS